MIRGLRIITNLDCNLRCKYCYQKDKSKKILDIETIKENIKQDHFEYITLMGGESLLYPNHLIDILKLVRPLSNEIALTTNGVLLTKVILNQLSDNGLTRINFSIVDFNPITFNKVTGANINTVNDNILMVKEDSRISIRVNVPVCDQGKEDLHKTIDNLLDNDMLFTLCSEQRYPAIDKNLYSKYDFELISTNGYGLCKLKYKDKVIHYYSHADNYKQSDLIISPVIVTYGWDKYCEAVK